MAGLHGRVRVPRRNNPSPPLDGGGRAERAGVVVAGAVFDPSKDEMFTAQLGGGAHLNGRPIRVSARAELALALIATGFGYDAGRRARQAEVVRLVLPVVRDIRRLGAASLDLCALACGRLDGYFERGLNLLYQNASRERNVWAGIE